MHEQNFSGTKRLYYDDSELRCFEAEVVSCEADPKGGYSLVLDQTAFFPEGGGQEGDSGFIVTGGNEQIRVETTTEKGGVIFHHMGQPVEAGAKVTGTLDWEVRFDRMQQHSGEHVLSGLINQKFGLNNVGFRLADDKTTLDFDGPLDRARIALAEALANETVIKDIPVLTFFPTKEEEAKINYRSKLDIEGQVRLVEIPGYDLCACCAPHVKHTYEIGQIKIVDAMNYKGGTRLTILCGNRALSEFGIKQDILTNLSQQLSVPQQELTSRVETLKGEIAESGYKILAWEKKYLGLMSPETFGEHHLLITEKLNADVVREYVNDRLSDSNILAVFTENGNGGYNYIIAAKNGDVREMGKALNQALSGRGGGKPGMIQGSVAASEEEIRNYFKNI